MTDQRPKRRRRRLTALALLVVAIVVMPVAAIEAFCRPAARATTGAPTQSNTGLSFPEWYVASSFEDFGRFLDRGGESGFPYAPHILGFWQSFCAISRSAAHSAQGPSRIGIHALGLRYSIEYAFKGLYENTAGRFTEWWRGPNPTPEDIYARAVAQDYAEFLHANPWHGFRFGERLRGLWAATPLGGPSAVRRFERKFALSAEYGIKAGAAWLTRTLSGPSNPSAREPRAAGESAGNRSVLIAAILPEGPAPQGVRELFSLPLASRPGFRRAGFDVEAGELERVTAELEKSGATVERRYAY